MFNNSGIPYSMAVAPISSSSNNGMGAWGDGAWWVIILFALIFGWGNGGWGGNGNNATQGVLTRGDLCMDMNFQELSNSVRAIQTGLANLGYDQMAQLNTVNQNINNGFSGLNATICQQQYDTANMLNQMNIANLQNANAANVVALQNANALQAQLADCCCKNEAGQLAIQNQIIQQTCGLTNAMNVNTRDIIDNQNAGTRAILDYLCQEKISDLQNENQALRLSASQERQNAYLIDQLRPTAVPAYITCSPYASAFGYPFNFQNGNSCGGCC